MVTAAAMAAAEAAVAAAKARCSVEANERQQRLRLPAGHQTRTGARGLAAGVAWMAAAAAAAVAMPTTEKTKSGRCLASAVFGSEADAASV